MGKVTIFRESCKGVDGCGICLFVCPKKLFSKSDKMNEAGYFPTEIEDKSGCTGCKNCMIYCPDFAIAVEDEKNGYEDTDETTDQ